MASGFVVGVDGWFYIFSEGSDESKPNRVASQDHKAVGDFTNPGLLTSIIDIHISNKILNCDCYSVSLFVR